MKSFLRTTLLVVGVIVVLALVAFGPQLVSHFTAQKATGPALATVARHSFPVVSTASGALQPKSALDVNFAISGQVTDIVVQTGATVSRGQLLAKLDDTVQQAELQGAQAAVAFAQSALDAAENGTSKGSIAAAQLQLAYANSQLQRAKADEARTLLTAPAAGTVLQINAQVGENVGAGGTHASNAPMSAPGSGGDTPFILIGNGTSFDVQASFNQSDAAQIKAGQSGSVTFDAVPGLGLPAHVASISNVATQVNGVPEFFADVTLDQSDPRLRSGMTATVKVQVAQADNVLSVPNQAVYTLDNTSHVDVWFHGAAVSTPVTLGLVGDQLTEITSGLTEGEQVVLPGRQGVTTPAPRAASTPAAS
jgi:macrolide-specific efflux system membrane fusion protein